MEHAIDPTGGSGEQWDAWEAMFSPRDPATDMPAPMFDARTGKIDRAVVNEHWSSYDITRMVREDWATYGPIVTGRVRLACGMLDSFFLQRAVLRFKETVEGLAEENGGWQGPGYVLMVEDATHGNLTRYIYQRKNREMREHFEKHGLGR